MSDQRQFLHELIDEQAEYIDDKLSGQIELNWCITPSEITGLAKYKKEYRKTKSYPQQINLTSKPMSSILTVD